MNDRPATTPSDDSIADRAPAPRELPTLCRLTDLLDAWESDARAACDARRAGRPRGPITGLAPLDRVLGGYLAPGVHVLHGNSNTGKTTLALQIATASPYPTLFASLEMPGLELFRRLVSRSTGTFLDRLRSGELPAETMLDLARRTASAYPQLLLADASRAELTAEWLLDAGRVARAQADHVLIVLDSAHAWVRQRAVALPEYEATNLALSALGRIARTLACPILVLAERNRLSMRDGGLNASAGSRSFEYSSETVLGLESKRVGTGLFACTLTVEKNPNGASGDQVALEYRGATATFRATTER